MKYLTVLLVDDDYLVLQDLQSIIDWNALGFQITGSASNGRTALAMLRRQVPDLIITDISMPVMDGFDFVENVQREFPETYVMFISSYADFDYAKRAMRDGIRDYLLKNELTAQSLTEQLLHVRETLHAQSKTRSLNLRFLLEAYFESSEDAGLPESLLSRRHFFFFLSYRLPLEKLSSHFRRVSQSGNELYQSCRQNILPRFPDACLFVLEEQVIVGITPKQLTPPFSVTALSQTCQTLQQLAAGTGERQVTASYLPRKLSLAECRKLRPVLFPLLHFRNSFPEEAGPDLSVLLDRAPEPVNQVFPYHLLKDSPDRPEVYREQLSGFVELLFDSCDTDGIFMLYHNLLIQMDELCGHMASFPQSGFFQGRSDFCAFLLRCYDETRRCLCRDNGDIYPAALTQAMEFMKQNYSSSSLTIEQIASAAYLSASRLSVLFRQETGQTVNDYLTDLRISQAIRLLEHSGYKIYEIAEMVGYKSSQYFSQVFSQRTGHKPLYFRRKKT